MKENKSLIVYKESIVQKIKNFFKNIFNKKVQNDAIEDKIQETSYIGSTKRKFNDDISFKENQEELTLINSIRENPESLKNMSIDELDRVENAIINRQKFVDKKIEKLKTDLMMKKKKIA